MADNLLSDVLKRLEALCREKRRVIVAIDGRGGAGKSSLARAIVANVSSGAHIELDWFHFPKGRASDDHRYDHGRLMTEVISPFRAGARNLTMFRYNWGYLAGVPEGFHEIPVTIVDKDILVIEGCEALHQSLCAHFDLRIWLDTDPEVALERGTRRDIDEYKLEPDRVRAAWREWTAWEGESLARDDRRKRADIIV